MERIFFHVIPVSCHMHDTEYVEMSVCCVLCVCEAIYSGRVCNGR